jgi:hypothetical protein
MIPALLATIITSYITPANPALTFAEGLTAYVGERIGEYGNRQGVYCMAWEPVCFVAAYGETLHEVYEMPWPVPPSPESEEPAPVPEPATALLVAAGVAAMWRKS